MQLSGHHFVRRRALSYQHTETHNQKMDEDCLFLNIWSPKSPPVDGSDTAGTTSKENAPKPVLVVIPGGGFISGGHLIKTI